MLGLNRLHFRELFAIFGRSCLPCLPEVVVSGVVVVPGVVVLRVGVVTDVVDSAVTANRGQKLLLVM